MLQGCFPFLSLFLCLYFFFSYILCEKKIKEKLNSKKCGRWEPGSVLNSFFFFLGYDLDLLNFV